MAGKGIICVIIDSEVVGNRTFIREETMVYIVLIIALFLVTCFLLMEASYHAHIAKMDDSQKKPDTMRWWLFGIIAGIIAVALTICKATPLWGAITAAVVEVFAWIVIVSLSTMKQYH